jgi:hypothetical protein
MADNLKSARLWDAGKFPSKSILPSFLLFSVAALHGEDDPKHILLRVRRTVVDTIERLPRYACTQTVDQSRYEPERASYERCQSGRREQEESDFSCTSSPHNSASTSSSQSQRTHVISRWEILLWRFEALNSVVTPTVVGLS